MPAKDKRGQRDEASSFSPPLGIAASGSFQGHTVSRQSQINSLGQKAAGSTMMAGVSAKLTSSGKAACATGSPASAPVG